jgi:hypothetical protein
MEKENTKYINESVHHYTFQTEDQKFHQIDTRIKNLSKLFNHIIQDFEIQLNKSKLNGVNSREIQLLTEFCEILNYDSNILNLPKTLPLDYLGTFYEILEMNSKLKFFYSNLNSKNISEYAKIADFFDVNLLEDILYLKLHEIFSSKENIEKFFKVELEEKNLKIENFTNITNEREKYLRDKYMIYCDKYIAQLSDEEIENILEIQLK